MSVKLEISLEDVAKQLHDSDGKHSTVQEVLDELYGVSLSAANILALVTGNITIPDLFKNFKPSKFLAKLMPKKYLNVSKEEASIHKYEKLSIANLSILLVSFNQAILENDEGIIQVISDIDTSTINIDSNSVFKEDNYFFADIENLIDKNNKKLLKTKCPLPATNKSESIDTYIEIMMSTFNGLFEMSNNSNHDSISQHLEESIKSYYYINLLEIASEFPEIKLWIDLNFQKNILEHKKDTKDILNEIEKFQNKEFSNQFSLQEMEEILSKNSNSTLTKIEDLLKDNSTILDYIEAHQKFIINTVAEELLEDNDNKDLVLPKKEEVYIPQSYKYFYYQENLHKKDYLDSNNWSKINHKEEENIGKELFQALRNPYNINQPIIILGHPGAGKSMFSSQFAYKLIGNYEFVPFLIKLRGVNSSVIDIDEHINKGIQNTVSGKPNINWVEWARKFPDKIPVIILDGFDELLRASTTQLNTYILEIQKMQKTAQNMNLNVRVILTSRLTIMQDVKIPEDSLVIKLNSFDEKRKKLWIDKWNEIQSDDKQFNLPNREDINELSKEPLLLFLLAIYDFESNALNKIAEKGLNKSLLYDKLFSEFTKRQLRKVSDYVKAGEFEQNELEDAFRLRIGFFAQMLFLHDRVHHYETDFDQELKEFNLNNNNNKAKNILDGFFFVHKDKSTDTHEIENLSFEFLHKTFGEFLSADFMLRMAQFRAEDDDDNELSSKEYFRQVFSFQWIYKQPKILDFFFEHSENLIDKNQSSSFVKFIKRELKALLDNSTDLILPNTLHKLKTFEKLKHSAIYSQNLFLLWISVEEDIFDFYLSNKLDNAESWRIFVDLWKNYGDYDYISYLNRFIDVNIEEQTCKISKISANTNFGHYTDFSHYTQLINNKEEEILSYYESDFTLEDLDVLLNIKEEKLLSKVSNLVISRLNYIYAKDVTFFNNSFWQLWNSCSFFNKLKLFDFFSKENIDFDRYRAITEIINNAYHNSDDISMSMSSFLEYIELLIKNSYDNKKLSHLVRNLFNTYRIQKDDSINNQLKFIELSFPFEPELAKETFFQVFEKYQEEMKKDKFIVLPIEKQLKFIELSKKFGPTVTPKIIQIVSKKFRLQTRDNTERPRRRYTNVLIAHYLQLIEVSLDYNEKLAFQLFNDLFENIRGSKRVALKDKINFVELSLIIEPKMGNMILEEIYVDIEENRKMNISNLNEDLKVIELSIATGQYTAKEILEQTYSYYENKRVISMVEKLNFVELCLKFLPEMARHILSTVPREYKNRGGALVHRIRYLEEQL